MFDILVTLTVLLSLAAVIWEINGCRLRDFFPLRVTRIRRRILNRSCGVNRLPIRVLDRMIYESNKWDDEHARKLLEPWFEEMRRNTRHV